MKQLIVAAALLLFLSVSANAQAAKALKIGVVDIETIVKELPEAQEADKQLREIGQKWQDSLLAMQKGLEERALAYEKQKGMMSAEQQQATEQELQQMQMTALQYREAKFGQQGELNQRRMNFLEPLRQKILGSIKKIAATEAMNLVLDKSNSSVLYAEDKMDITYRVLDELKRGK